MIFTCVYKVHYIVISVGNNLPVILVPTTIATALWVRIVVMT